MALSASGEGETMFLFRSGYGEDKMALANADKEGRLVKSALAAIVLRCVWVNIIQ